MGYSMKSIIQKEKECYICGSKNNLHLHHIFFGTANRKISDENGFTCYLCHQHHNGQLASVHFNKKMDLMLKEICQKVYELRHTREEFMKLIGKNYLDD